MSWKDYLERHAHGRTNVDLADLAGVSGPQVGKWRRGVGGVDATTVIRFARAVGDKPLGALVEAGFLTAEEARQRPAAPPSLAQLTDDQLLDEVRARMSEGRDGHGHQPAPIDDDPGGVVAELHQLDAEARRRAAAIRGDIPDDVAARRPGSQSRTQQEREQQDQDGEE